MYRLRHFKEVYGKCCVPKVGSSFTENRIYDIDAFSLKNFMNEVIGLFTPCETVYLNWLYWYVLLLSVLKMVGKKDFSP